MTGGAVPPGERPRAELSAGVRTSTPPLAARAVAGYLPSMLDVRRLRVLREVARRGSLAGAADGLS
jgi:hypothetical protein